MGEKEGVGELGAEIARERKGRRGKRKKGGDEKTFHERRRDFSRIKQATAWLIARHPGTHVDPPAFFRDAWLPAPLKHAHPVFRKQKGATRGDEALWAHPLLDHGA